jgi:hypothetical protein
LIHSVRGQSRSCCVLSAYMMKKYNWGLRKTMEFLSSRRPDLNLKPAFLQQLSGYERRLMAQSKHPPSLDWNDADFSHLECEELLLRNTYINSQMGPLAEFNVGDSASVARPRRLVWADNSQDEKADKIRLEKPAGVDRHNLQSCKRTQSGQPVLMGQPIMKPIIKVKTNVPPATAPDMSRPNGDLHEAHAGPDVFSHGAAPGFMETSAGYGIAGVKAVPFMSAGPPGGFLEGSVPTAWGDSDSSSIPHACATSSIPVGPSVLAYDGGYPPAQGDYYTTNSMQGSFFQRGPANHIRDSLNAAPSRRDGSVTREDGKPGSRDPSPKTSQARRDSPLYRGESPLRLLSRSGQGQQPSNGRAPSPGAVASQPCGGQRGPPPAFMNSAPAAVNLGLGFGGMGIRSGASGGPPQAMMAGVGRGAGPPRNAVGASGMGAFRSGGPVRANADLAGALRDEAGMRRNSGRPVAVTSQRNSSSRQASPLGGPGSGQQRSGSSSRPGSPQARPPSPNPPVNAANGARAPYDNARNPYANAAAGPPLSASYPSPLSSLDGKQRPRSLSSHMRRAPSPTPAFNRHPSPSRPRWRM